MLLILASALFFSSFQSKKSERRLLLFEELLRFLEKVRVDISCYLKPISEIARDFDSEPLSAAGFLSDLEKLGPSEAYRRLEPLLSPTEEEKKLLESFFFSLGMGYADDQIKLIDETLSEYKRLLSIERERAPKNKKLSLCLSSAGALALIILLM